MEFDVVWNGTMDRNGTSPIQLAHPGPGSSLAPGLTVYEPTRTAPAITYGGLLGVDHDVGFAARFTFGQAARTKGGM